jgi:CRP/FNR family cyclic AMP-dependent transcriptional regulator
MEETKKEFLKGISIFSGLNDEELDILAQATSEKHVRVGERIVTQGEAGDSLLLIRSGQVKIVLQPSSGEEIPLSMLGPDEFFGEMSLFDQQPRSATAIALLPSQIVEIHREPFLSEMQGSPEIALKILSEISHRMRNTDTMVRSFADKVSTEALGSLEGVLKERLEAVEKLYATTEKRAMDALERAERTVGQVEDLWKERLEEVERLYAATEERASATLKEALDTLERAKGVADQIETQREKIAGQIEKVLKRLIRYGSVALTVIAFITGYSVWDFRKILSDVKVKESQITTWHNQAQKSVEDIREDSRSVRILKETNLEISAIRATILPDYKDIKNISDDDLKTAFLNYHPMKSKLQSYLHNKDGKEYDPKVVLAAVETLWSLRNKGERDSPEILTDLREALTNVVRQADQLNWRETLRVRTLLQDVAKDIEQYDIKQYKTLLNDLYAIVMEKHLTEQPKFHAALVLANLQYAHLSPKEVKQFIAFLNQTMKEKIENGSFWRATLSAIRLIQIGGQKEKNAAWKYLREQLNETSKYSLHAALSLGQLGNNTLKYIDTSKYIDRGVESIVEKIKQGEKRNVYQKEYARRVVECLKYQNTNICP